MRPTHQHAKWSLQAARVRAMSSKKQTVHRLVDSIVQDTIAYFPGELGRCYIIYAKNDRRVNQLKCKIDYQAKQNVL